MTVMNDDFCVDFGERSSALELNERGRLGSSGGSHGWLKSWLGSCVRLHGTIQRISNFMRSERPGTGPESRK